MRLVLGRCLSGVLPTAFLILTPDGSRWSAGRSRSPKYTRWYIGARVCNSERVRFPWARSARWYTDRTRGRASRARTGIPLVIEPASAGDNFLSGGESTYRVVKEEGPRRSRTRIDRQLYSQLPPNSPAADPRSVASTSLSAELSAS